MLKTEGIVIGETRYKETSKILNIYTKDLGKISVLAQGALKPKSHLLATTQMFSHSEFQFRKGKSFYYIQQADLIKSLYSLGENIERITWGFYILELMNKSVENEEKNEKFFSFLKKGLYTLSKLEGDYLKFIVAYELKFISFLGYRPYIDRCVACNNRLSGSLKFSINLGGALCSSCFSEDCKAVKIYESFLAALNKLLYNSFEDLKDIAIDERLLKSIHDVLVAYILYNIDRKEFKSLNLINL